MSSHQTQPFTAGKFLITPLARSVKNGGFTAALSIRRGQGTQTHDRIYGFTPEFECRESALVYAAVQGRYWPLNSFA